ncbi:MAG: thioredoxin domain-containing protein [Planctomycetota bacterium]|nr:thioredoxin domain-containing protein [Planctomycetota bacterium]
MTAFRFLVVCTAILISRTVLAEDPEKKHPANHLIHETSPYLLTHAHNPVDWYPWGEEAFAKAKKESKLIFLSVGYSSCHWCHVMERESFEDQEIADYLNKHYICIKVDREERPDVDQVYMAAVQVLTQRGGWPMSVFLLPDAKPFTGGSYFPARDGDRQGLPGFLTIIKRLQEVWNEEPDLVTKQAVAVTNALQSELEARIPRALEPLDQSVLSATVKSLSEKHDEQWGGFGYSIANPQVPKFPTPSNLDFLLFQINRLNATGQDSKLEMKMLANQLDHMAMGGIRDHLGGGFHRYSVDRYWHIPHFEKMLYDNAQLASIYAAAYKLTGTEEYKQVTHELLEFVLREMTDENGGFYSAIDADSEGIEGKYYRWSRDEVKELLSAEEYEVFADIYSVTGAPNFEEHFYALLMSKTRAEFTTQRAVTIEQFEQELMPIRQKLLAERSKRIRPLLDNKILASWNGLMIRGFADAGRLLDHPKYIEAAEKAADFIVTNMRNDEGQLLHSYNRGEARFNAYLVDYAYLVEGLLSLHRATGEKKWLMLAEEFTQSQIDRYWDDRHGGFFFTSSDHESLIARAKNPIDSVRPSGNSVSAANLLYLYSKLGNPEYLKYAQKTVDSVSGMLSSSPGAAPRTVMVLGGLLDLSTP